MPSTSSTARPASAMAACTAVAAMAAADCGERPARWYCDSPIAVPAVLPRTALRARRVGEDHRVLDVAGDVLDRELVHVLLEIDGFPVRVRGHAGFEQAAEQADGRPPRPVDPEHDPQPEALVGPAPEAEAVALLVEPRVG